MAELKTAPPSTLSQVDLCCSFEAIVYNQRVIVF